MLLDALPQTFVTLLVIIDPIALGPVFLTVTAGMDTAMRRQVAVRACLIALVVLAAVAFGGARLLGQLGISLPAFRIAGGLLLFWIAFEMVFERRNDRRTVAAEQAITKDHIRRVAAFPLAIPLMAGPGAITATILLAGAAGGRVLDLAVLVGLIAIVIAICFVVFLAAERLGRLLGTTGNVVVSRLLGIILAALAVQIVIDGVKATVAG